MIHPSLHGSSAAVGMLLFASGPPRLWRRRADRRISRTEVLLPVAMLFALTAISTIAAIEYPLSLTDILNQF
jgi:membrane-associated phospholipid phosphatase